MWHHASMPWCCSCWRCWCWSCGWLCEHGRRCSTENTRLVLLLAALLQLALEARKLQPQLGHLHIPVKRIQAVLIQLLLVALLQLAPQAHILQPQLSHPHIPVKRSQAVLMQLLLLDHQLVDVLLLLMPKLLKLIILSCNLLLQASHIWRKALAEQLLPDIRGTAGAGLRVVGGWGGREVTAAHMCQVRHKTRVFWLGYKQRCSTLSDLGGGATKRQCDMQNALAPLRTLSRAPGP